MYITSVGVVSFSVNSLFRSSASMSGHFKSGGHEKTV